MRNGKSTNEINKKYKKVQINEPFSFKWIVKIEVIIILILLLFVFFLNIIPFKTKFKLKYNLEKVYSILFLNEKLDSDNKRLENINLAINENPYLSYNEKEFIKKVYEKEINENLEYINLEDVNRKLKTLEISYNNSNKKLNYNFKVYKSIAGEYNIYSNKIFIYDSKENFNKPFDDISLKDKEIYFHELNHVLTNYTLSSKVDLFAKNIENKNNDLLNTKLLKNLKKEIILVGKNTFTETVNELFTREYIEIYSEKKLGLNKLKAYSEYMPFTYVLAEILDEKTLREYKFNDNQNIIINGLLEINNNFDKIFELITSINSIDYYVIYENDSKREDEIYKKIYESLSYFYEKKFNKNLQDDLVILSYLYNTNVLEEEYKSLLENYLQLDKDDKIIDVIPKGYVSNEYKTENNYVKIEYIKDGEKQYFELNDTNRFLN